MNRKLSPVTTLNNYKQDIDDALERLVVLSNQHFNINPQKASWSDVGYLEHLSELLINAIDFAFQEGVCSDTGERHETIN